MKGMTLGIGALIAFGGLAMPLRGDYVINMDPTGCREKVYKCRSTLTLHDFSCFEGTASTPLIAAVSICDPEIVQALLAAGAMPHWESAKSKKEESLRIVKRCSDFTDRILHPRARVGVSEKGTHLRALGLEW